MTYRILVTGSRDWPDEDFVWMTLAGFVIRDDLVLVSGACPTGADRMAENAFEAWRLPIERHPAEWDKYGKRAGFLRNAEMVESGIDLTLAFIYHESKGATMTWNLSVKKGIEGYAYTEADL